jgi:integrase
MARAKRRPNREGSIWRRQDGRWTGAAYVLTASGILKRTYVYGRTREEAHAKLVQLQDRSARGIPRPDRAWRVGEYLDYWLTEVAKPAVRPTTYAKYEVMVRLYLRPALGHHRLDRLSVVAVQDYLNGRVRAGDSLAKVHVIRAVLAAALTRAMREDLVPRNVARLAALPPAVAARQQPWSADEARRFLSRARSDPLYAAFVLMLVYGLRRGEVLGLAWTEVDFGNATLHIRQQLFRARGVLQLGPVKTAAGRRELPLLGIARDALMAHSAMQVIGGPHRAWARHELVFTTGTGYPVEPRNLARSFHRIAKAEGLPPIRLHGLRHTTATLLKTLGVPARDAMGILGHSRVAVTLEVYTDADDPSRKEAIDRISRLLDGGDE